MLAWAGVAERRDQLVNMDQPLVISNQPFPGVPHIPNDRSLTDRAEGGPGETQPEQGRRRRSTTNLSRPGMA